MLVNNDSTVPDTDIVVIVERDETNIVSPSNINSNLRENEEETSIVPTLVTSINLNDPAYGQFPSRSQFVIGLFVAYQLSIVCWLII